MKSYLKTGNKDNCCGCGNCENICVKNAIKMVPDEEGFLYPEINIQVCNHCNACLKVCTYENELDLNKEIPKAYYGWRKNDSKRKESASGGLFSEIAERFLESGGWVCGCAYDESMEVVHIIGNTTKEVDRMKGSKYVQSNMGDICKKIKQLLNNNEQVLFSGTPCQVDAVKKYVGTEYDNLYTVDLICHGVPSPKLFDEYLKLLARGKKEDIEKFSFRYKSKNFLYGGYVSFKNKKVKVLGSNSCSFINSYMKNKLHRKSCYKCMWAQEYRVGDITLGDFWGGEKRHSDVDLRKGVSLIICNNKKGAYLLENVKEGSFLQETDLKYAISHNGNLSYPSTKPAERDELYRKIFNEKNFSVAEKKYLRGRYHFLHVIASYIPVSIKNKLRRK